MKNIIRFFLSGLIVVVFISCTQINGGEGNISFPVDGIIKAVERAGGGSDNYTISVKVTGGYEAAVSKSISSNEIGTDKSTIIIPDIPAGRVVTVFAGIEDSAGFLVFDGKSDSFKVKAGVNDVKIGLDDSEVYVLWSKLKDNPDAYSELADLKFSFFKELNEDGETLTSFGNKYLEDFCFDKKQNIYTIEKNAAWDEDGEKWTFSSVEICKYCHEDFNKREVLFSSTDLTNKLNTGHDYNCISTDGENIYLGRFTNTSSADLPGSNGVNCGTVSKIYTLPCNVNKTPEEFFYCTGGYPSAIEASGKDYIYFSVIDDEQASGSNRGTFIHVVNKQSKEELNSPQVKNSSNPSYIVDMQLAGDKLYLLNANYDTSRRVPRGEGGDFCFLPVTDLNEKFVPVGGAQNIKSINIVNLNNADLVGPIKFVALKPKKLFIAYDGFTRSGADCYAANSVATVDIGGTTPSLEEKIKLNKFDFNGINHGSAFVN